MIYILFFGFVFFNCRRQYQNISILYKIKLSEFKKESFQVFYYWYQNRINIDTKTYDRQWKLKLKNIKTEIVWKQDHVVYDKVREGIVKEKLG